MKILTKSYQSLNDCFQEQPYTKKKIEQGRWSDWRRVVILEIASDLKPSRYLIVSMNIAERIGRWFLSFFNFSSEKVKDLSDFSLVDNNNLNNTLLSYSHLNSPDFFSSSLEKKAPENTHKGLFLTQVENKKNKKAAKKALTTAYYQPMHSFANGTTPKEKVYSQTLMYNRVEINGRVVLDETRINGEVIKNNRYIHPAPSIQIEEIDP